VDLIPVIPWWSVVVVAVLVWFLSVGYRQREYADTERTQRYFQRMADPAQKDVRRVGGVLTGLLFIFWAMLQEIVRFGNDLFGLGSDILTTYPDFMGFISSVTLGWAGLSGRVSLASEHYLGLALVIGSLVLMVKN